MRLFSVLEDLKILLTSGANPELDINIFSEERELNVLEVCWAYKGVRVCLGECLDMCLYFSTDKTW